MNDPRIAALAEAMEQTSKAGEPWATYPEWAAAILAALPPDWCGHTEALAVLKIDGKIGSRDVDRIRALWSDANHVTLDVVDSQAAEIVRLRKIEEAAREWRDRENDLRDAAYMAADEDAVAVGKWKMAGAEYSRAKMALHAALEEKP